MTYEWIAEWDGCDWTEAHALIDVAYAMLEEHINTSTRIRRRAA
jgi:hypothetical protein